MAFGLLVSPAASMSMAAQPTIITGVSTIADRYDAVLLDQFGVMHNGKAALPGALQCFNSLAQQNKKLIVLSNTSRRRAFALQRLDKIGFDAEQLSDFVTSGEAAWRHMQANCAGQSMLHIGWDDAFHAFDSRYMEGLDVTLAPASDCDFVFLQGSQCLRDGSGAPPADCSVFATGHPSEALSAALETCAARGVTMLCANPDYTVVLPDDTIGHMPGKIASLYEALGGAVTYFGKPHVHAFAEALRQLGPSIPPSRVLHVGDSLLHDVAGANAAGVHSLFVASGIHSEELGIEDGGDGEKHAAELSAEKLQQVFARHAIQPTLSIATFCW